MSKHRDLADVGIIGVGAIAESITVGLCKPTPRSARSIVLSPRGEARSRSLAERFLSVRVAEDNQAVVDESRLVLVCVRPALARQVLAGLTFRSDSVVVSVMAGLSLAQLAPLVSPAVVIVRAVPLPAVAVRQGLTAMYPGHRAVVELFDELGGTMVMNKESVLDAVSASTATAAAHLACLGAIGDWLVKRGTSRTDARRLVGALYGGVAAHIARSPADFAELSAEYATAGGINEQFLDDLQVVKCLGAIGAELDVISVRLAGSVADLPHSSPR